MEKPPAFNPLDYPRTYKPDLAFVWFYSVFGTLLFLCGAWLITEWLMAPQRAPLFSDHRTLGIFAIFFGCFFLRGCFHTRLVLHADRVEYRNIFCTRVMYRDDIGGYRKIGYRDPRTALVPKPGVSKYICIPRVFDEDDPSYKEWIESLPDLSDRR